MIDVFLQGDLVSIFIKLFGVVLSILYLFFTIILIRQIDTMQRTVMFIDHGILGTVAYFQAILAAFIVFYALFVL